MNIREELQKAGPGSDGLYFNPVDVVPDRIYAVLINEVVPEDPGDDFYGGPDAAYLTTALPLFQEAGIRAGTILDILSQGIYLTNAVKMPKPESTCLLYTSDAADDSLRVDLGGRRIIKKIFSSRRRHTRFALVSWARRCV